MAVLNTLSSGWLVRKSDARLPAGSIPLFVTDSTFGWNLIPESTSFHDVVVEDSGGRLRMRVLFQTGGTFVGIESMVRLLLHGRTFAKTAAAPMREALLPRKQCHYGEWERQQERILHPDVYLPTIMSLEKPWPHEQFYSNKGGVHVRRLAFGGFLESVLEHAADLNLLIGYGADEKDLQREFQAQQRFLLDFREQQQQQQQGLPGLPPMLLPLCQQRQNMQRQQQLQEQQQQPQQPQQPQEESQQRQPQQVQEEQQQQQPEQPQFSTSGLASRCSVFAPTAAAALPFTPSTRTRWSAMEFGDDEDQMYCEAVLEIGKDTFKRLHERLQQRLVDSSDYTSDHTSDYTSDYSSDDEATSIPAPSAPVAAVVRSPFDAPSLIPTPTPAPPDWIGSSPIPSTIPSSSSSYRSNPYTRVERWVWGPASRRHATPGLRDMGGYGVPGTGKNPAANARKKAQKERMKAAKGC